MTENNISDDYEKLIHATTFQEQTPETDLMYQSLVKVLTYRREVAVAYQRADEKQKEYLYDVFKHCNDNIKQLLGL